MFANPMLDIVTIREAFEHVDRDKSGQIDHEEFVSLFKRLGKHVDEEGIDQLIKSVDQNGDDKISWLEFLCAAMDGTLEAAGISMQFYTLEKLTSLVYQVYTLYDPCLIYPDQVVFRIQKNGLEVLSVAGPPPSESKTIDTWAWANIAKFMAGKQSDDPTGGSQTFVRTTVLTSCFGRYGSVCRISHQLAEILFRMRRCLSAQAYIF
jgi:hypothetical protein